VFDALAHRNVELHADQVRAGYFFGDGVLDLDAGVHFEEVEFAVAVEQEFDGAGVRVMHGAREANGGFAHAVAQFLADAKGRRFFDDLLVAALDGAVAFTEMQNVAMCIAENLHFDVTDVVERLFQGHAIGGEGGERLAAGGGKGFGEIRFRNDAALAAPAATERGLDEDGPADLLGFGEKFGIGLVVAVVAGDDGDVCRHRNLFRFALVAHRADGVGRGTNPDEAGVDHALREVGVLGQEAVARVYGFRTCHFGGGDDAVGVQIRLLCRRWADVDGDVGIVSRAGAFVRIGIDGDGAQVQGLRFAHDAFGDFAAVGDEDGFEGAVER